MLRLVEKKEVIVYRQQTNCTWEKNCFVFRLRCSVACSKLKPAKFRSNQLKSAEFRSKSADFFSFVCISDSDIYCLLFCLLFLGTAVSLSFKSPIIKNFLFFTPCFHNIFFFFQFRMNNQLINICLFVFNSSFSSEISQLQAVPPKLSL
jgi:hypothetical protein